MSETHQTIDRLDQPTPETLYRNYISANKPVIITGVASRWEAVSCWNPEYFKSAFPDTLVTVRGREVVESAGESKDVSPKKKKSTVRLGAFVDSMRSGNHPVNFALSFPLFERIPQLRSEIGSLDPYMRLPPYLPQALRRRLKVEPRCFFGPTGYGAPLHFDSHNNFYVQIHGRKNFILVSPEQSRFVYYPWDYRYPSFSPVDVSRPDLDKFPLFQKATPLEFVVESGEILFIPVRWWHSVLALEESISLSFWWTSASIVSKLWHPFFVQRTGRLINYRK
jgi:lysine-specific demethylase 8